MKAQKIIFVTGKGGVGKSTVALSVAKKLANTQNKVLLVELGDQSFYEEFLNYKASGELHPLSENLHIALWSGHKCLKKYIAHYIKVNKVVDIFLENKVMKTLIEASPGLKELSLLGRITSGARNFGPPLEYDYIVVDSYSTGHFLALLRAPVGMYEVIKFGPMGQQCSAIIDVLKNRELCNYLIVTLPESLPVEEGIELKESLREEFNAEPQFVLNRIQDFSVLKTALKNNELEDVQTKEDHQKQSILTIENNTKKFFSIPMCFENDGKKLTDKLSTFLEGL